MKKLVIRILFLFAFICNTFAQNVSNVAFYQEGTNVVVTYSLDKVTEVSLHVSTDGGKNFSTPLKKVSGNVGKNTLIGVNRIVWDVLSEREKLTGSNIVFLVRTQPLSIFNQSVQFGNSDIDSLVLTDIYQHYIKCTNLFVETCDLSNEYFNAFVKQPTIAQWTPKEQNTLQGLIKSYCKWVRVVNFLCWGDYEEGQLLLGKIKKYLVQSKVFRDFVYNKVCEGLEKYCKIYSQDFRNSLLSELEELITTVKEIDSGKYKIVTEYHNGWAYKVFYVNGKKDWDFGYTNKAFVLRRYFCDNITQEELLTKLTDLYNRIKNVDNSQQPQRFYSVKVDNSIDLVIDSDGQVKIEPIYGGEPLCFNLSTWAGHCDFTKITKYKHEKNYILWGKNGRKVILNQYGNVLYER